MASKKKSSSRKAAQERAQIMAQGRNRGTQSLSPEQLAKLTAGQKKKLGIGVTQTGLDVPGRTRGGTDFSTVPQTPGAISADGTRLVPVGTPGSTVPPTTPTQAKPQFSFNTQDEQYLTDMEARRQAFNTMLANTTAGEENLASAYGFGFQRYGADQRNADGVLVARQGDVDLTSLSAPSNFDQSTGLDPRNPFSRASLLNQSYMRAGRIGDNNYANRGLLTSGAYQRSLGRNATDRLQSFDALQKDFAARLNEYRGQRGSGYTQYETDRTGIFRDAFERQRNAFLANNS